MAIANERFVVIDYSKPAEKAWLGGSFPSVTKDNDTRSPEAEAYIERLKSEDRAKNRKEGDYRAVPKSSLPKAAPPGPGGVPAISAPASEPKASVQFGEPSEIKPEPKPPTKK